MHRQTKNVPANAEQQFFLLFILNSKWFIKYDVRSGQREADLTRKLDINGK
jgi:hypothetical protein